MALPKMTRQSRYNFKRALVLMNHEHGFNLKHNPATLDEFSAACLKPEVIRFISQVVTLVRNCKGLTNNELEQRGIDPDQLNFLSQMDPENV